MDTAICGGDFALGANGLPYRISGKEALLQRAYILLRIPKGSFCYQTDLGSEIALLEQDEEFSMRVKEAAQEALRELDGITVSSVETDLFETKAVCRMILETDQYGRQEIVLELPREGQSGDI